MGKNSAAELAQHAQIDDAEAASIGARVDPSSGKWYDLKDGHYIAAKEADQRLGRTTAQGNADRAGGNVGTSFWDAVNPLSQIRSAAHGDWHQALMPDPIAAYTGNNIKIAGPVLDTVASIYGGPAGGAAAGALDKGLEPGANVGDIAKGAGEGLVIGQAGKLAVNGVGSLLGSGGSAASSAAAGAGANAGTSGLPAGIGALSNDASNTGGFLSGITNATGLTTADILKLGGSALTAGTNYAENAAQLAERKREFDASNALASQNTAAGEGQLAVNTQNRLNTAPLADKSQYLLSAMQSAGPTPFKPRDYTQPGTVASNLSAPATGGAQAQLAANNAASANYTPGAGGVDTSALQLLLAKLKGSGSAYGTMPTTGGTG